ncbi:MAG TPA: hypothetical protein VGR35_10740 [Tepidisphaeraceae bacterium]|nr:hypothetical protein [Tepidisphaeraceae bacterium]
MKAFDEALAIARSIEAGDLEGVALYGLGRVAAAESNHDEACDRCLRGLNILDGIGHYKVTEVRRWLATYLVEWAETLMRYGDQGRALELLNKASNFCSAREESLLSIHHRISHLQRRTVSGDSDNSSAPVDGWLAVAPWQLDDFGRLLD